MKYGVVLEAVPTFARPRCLSANASARANIHTMASIAPSHTSPEPSVVRCPGRMKDLTMRLTCKGPKRFRLSMFAMDKDSRAVTVAILGKALHYQWRHVVHCHRKRCLYLFPTPSIRDVHGRGRARTVGALLLALVTDQLPPHFQPCHRLRCNNFSLVHQVRPIKIGPTAAP